MLFLLLYFLTEMDCLSYRSFVLFAFRMAGVANPATAGAGGGRQAHVPLRVGHPTHDLPASDHVAAPVAVGPTRICHSATGMDFFIICLKKRNGEMVMVEHSQKLLLTCKLSSCLCIKF